MKPDQERVRSIIHTTIVSLCENGLKFDKNLRIEGVIGVTTDEQEIFIIHINESLNADSCSSHLFPGGRQLGIAPGGGVPKPIMRRPSQEAFARAKPPVQFSPNSPMGFRGLVRGPLRMGLGSPRMVPGIQRSQVPAQRTPTKSPRNASQGMPRLQRFSPQARLTSPNPCDFGDLGRLSLPAPLTREVSGDRDQAFPQKLLFPPGLRRNSSSQSPQIGDGPCKVDVILVDDDDHVESERKSVKTEGGTVEPGNDTGPSPPNLKPEICLAGSASPAGPGGDGACKDAETEVPGQCEQKVEDQSTSAIVPGCSGIASDAPKRTDQDEKSSTRASVDNSSIASFEMNFSLDTPFNPEDYVSEDDDLEDMSFTDPSDEDWDMDQETVSDPDWSDRAPRKRKRRTTPKKSGLPRGSVLGQKQVSNVPSQSWTNPSLKFGRFTQVPQTLLNSGSAEEESWKLVARFVCNISGCNASFSQKYNLLRHQRVKHGFGKASSRCSSRSLMQDPNPDEADA